MYPRRFLFLSFIVCFAAACTSDYKLLRATRLDESCAKKTMPREFKTAWYNASVDVAGKYISGLMLFKQMPDSSTRIVFTNEAGVKFFDFGFSHEGTFTVHQAIKQLNKKAVITILQQDFALLLGLPFRTGMITAEQDSAEFFFGAHQKKETAYFITPKDCASLRRLEWRAGRKKMVSVEITGEGYPSPENIRLKHHTFNMEILLTRMPTE